MAGLPALVLRAGDAARPSFALARAMLRRRMPELVPAWERLVELAGGGDLAARMLSLYHPPPLVSGCSQAVFARPEPVLVRNYDFDPDLLEGVVYASALTGRRVVGMSDCLWGLLDGMNDDGLAVSLAFGGRRTVDEGFAIPLVVRYLLEMLREQLQLLPDRLPAAVDRRDGLRREAERLHPVREALEVRLAHLSRGARCSS